MTVSPTAQVPGAPFHKQPVFEFVSTIAYEPENNLRDPSSVIQDPGTGRWHFWVDWMPGGPTPAQPQAPAGWQARLKHFSAPADVFDRAPARSRNISDTTGSRLTNHGFALDLSSDPNAADSTGQFSLSVIYGAGAPHHGLSPNTMALITSDCDKSAPRAPNGPDHLGLRALQTPRRGSGGSSTRPPRQTRPRC